MLESLKVLTLQEAKFLQSSISMMVINVTVLNILIIYGLFSASRRKYGLPILLVVVVFLAWLMLDITGANHVTQASQTVAR